MAGTEAHGQLRKQIACPACGYPSVTDFFTALGAPVTCTSIFESPEAARAVPCGEIRLAACGACSLAFNRCFDPALAEIGARYESSQAASGHFAAFAQSLALDWIDRYNLRGKTVLEIGSGGGDFLDRLLRGGVGRVIGIDPLAAPVDASSSQDDRRTVIADRFDERYLDLAADAVVCRHTLEHVQNVGGFLRLVRNWAAREPHRVLLFELPAAERVFAERAFWDIYYEHCNYFSAASLRYAFEAAGLEVLSVRRMYGEQYLVIEAAPGSPRLHSIDAVAALADYRRYDDDVRASIARCDAELARLRDVAPPLVLWQGAAKTVGLLTMLGNSSVVDAAIDLSPQRHGRFLPGSGLPVYAPENLRHLRPGNIVLMNPVYMTEVTTLVRNLGLDTPVTSINDLLAARRAPS